MTPSERIAKIRELLNGVAKICIYTDEMPPWTDDDLRQALSLLDLRQALSLLDGIETEGAIERAMKEKKVVITDADTEQRHIEYWNGIYYTFASFIQVSENIVEFADEDNDGILLYEGMDFSAALAALLGEEPPQ